MAVLACDRFNRSHATLVLQHVALVGCAAPVIVLEEHATLQLLDVVLSGHQAGNETLASQLGFIIHAGDQASVHMERVSVVDNHADNVQPVHTPFGADSPPVGFGPGAPSLSSSLIHLANASMHAIGCTLASNTGVSALISASAGAPQVLRLQGCNVTDNKVAWLLVADSWYTDILGRQLITHPGAPMVTQKTLPSVASSWTTRTPFLASLPDSYTVTRLIPGTDSNPRASEQQRRAVRDGSVALAQLVGRVADGQTPLQLLLQDTTVTSNLVMSGLLWVRLVNTTLNQVVIQGNMAQGSSDSAHGSSMCAVRSTRGALLQVLGSAAFHMNR